MSEVTLYRRRDYVHGAVLGRVKCMKFVSGDTVSGCTPFYTGTSPKSNSAPLGPHRTLPRALWKP
jgi:hypothetical protein